MGGVALFAPVTPAPIESNEAIQTQQATLGDILAQKQQREQLVQDNAIKLQQQRQEQQDQQNFSKAYRDNNYDMDAALKAAPRYNVSADGMAKRAELHQKFQQGAVTLDDGKLKNLEAHGNLLAGYLDPITRITDPDPNIQTQKRAAAWSDAYNQYQQVDPEGAKSVSPQYPGDDGLQSALEHAMMIKGYADHGLKIKQTAREDVGIQKDKSDLAAKNLELSGRTLPASINWNDPEAAQATWSGWRSKLSPEQQATVPEQGTPDAEKQVRTQAMTVEQQAVNQRAQAQLQDAQARLAAEGITPDDIKGATDPNATPESRRAAADAIVKRKGDAAAQVEIAKQLGVVTALLGGSGSPTSGQNAGAVATPAPTSGAVQIPTQAPGQPGVTQLAAQNNNPGNLRFAGQPGAKPGVGNYAAFPTPEAGYTALQNQIAIDTKKGLTLQQYITKYAPPSENDTAGYLARAAQATGADPKTPLAQIDANKLAQFQAKQESSSTVNGTPSANGRNEAVLEEAVKAGKISQATANEIRAVAGGAPYWAEHAGPLGMANEVKKQLLAQYSPSYLPTTITNPATVERLAKDKAIQDAFRDSGYDWNKVTENVRAGKYDKFASDIADHAEKMGKLPPAAATVVARADATKQQIQAGIDAIREVVKNHPELVGNAGAHPINALRRKGETFLGSEPADVGATDSILESAMALQPGFYQFRSIQALADFKKAVGIDPKTGKADGSRGWLVNPQKVIDGLQATADFAENLKQNTLKANGRQSRTPIQADPALKRYADQYFGGDIQKAIEYNKNHGK